MQQVANSFINFNDWISIVRFQTIMLGCSAPSYCAQYYAQYYAHEKTGLIL